MPQHLNRLATLLLLCVLVLGMSVVSAQDAETTPEATAEVTQEAPVVVVTEEPVAEVTAEPTEVVPTAEVTEEPVVDLTEEPTQVVPTEEATVAPTEVPLEAEPALSLLFYDAFDAADASNWVPAAGWFMADGAYQAANGAALTSQPTFLPAPAQFYNVSAQARFKLSAGSVQLSVRANGPVAYTASLDASGTVSLVRAGEVVQTIAIAPVTLDAWTDVRISAYNGSVRVFVGGLPVIEWADAAPLPPGTVVIAPVAPTDGSGSILIAEDFVLWVPTAEFGNYPTQPVVVVTEEPTAIPTAEVTVEPTVEVTEEPLTVDPLTGKSLVPFDINAMPPMAGPPPDNDNLSQAANVAVVPYVVESTTAGAAAARETNEVTPAGCGFNISHTVWFSFTPATTGNYDISTAGTAFDTILGLYTGAAYPLTLVACNDDVAGSQQARILNRSLTAGTTYLIQLGGYNGNRGEYTFAVQFSGLPVPGAPTQALPLNKAVTGNNGGNVTFTWTAPTTGGPTIDYVVEIDNTTDFSSPLFAPEDRIVAGLSKSFAIPDGKWYWRVSARNINGASGPYSARREFTQDTVAPIATILKTPADESLLNTNRPTLTWGKVTGATRYAVTLSPVGGSPVLDGVQTAATSLALKPAALATPLAQGCYEWSVVALDAGTNPSPASDEFTFCVNLAKTPANNSNVIDATLPANPKFTWAALGVAGATYVIEISTNDDFTNIVHTSAPTTALLYTVPATETDLVAGTYYWRVVPNAVVPPAEIFFAFSVSPALPPKVTLSLPANNAILFDNTPDLDWTDAPAAPVGITYTYELQVATANTFAPAALVVDEDVAGNTSTYSVSPALEDGKYYWRVRVRDNNGALGAWATLRAFTIDTVAKQISPLDNSFTLDDTPVFKWDKVPGAVAYRLLIDNNDDLLSPLADVYQGPGSTFTLPAARALADGTWYWGVAFSFDGTNFEPVADIEPWTFGVVSAFLPAPVITLPLNNGSVSDTRPQFTWNAVTGASEYLCQIGTDARFRTIVWEDEVAATTCTEPGEELLVGRYYARVAALDAIGAPSKFSKTVIFNIDVTAPDAPSFISPANGSTSSSLAPVISWRKPTGAVAFDIRFDNELPLTDADIPGNGNNITPTRYTANIPAAGETWYFQVRGIDAAGNESDWSSILSIKFVSAAGVAPTPNRTSDPTPQLSWTPISWALGYEVQIARTNTFAAGTLVTGSDTIPVNPTNWSPTTDLAEGTYYWRVRAKSGAATWGNWSSVGIFLVDF